jgi:hypothetical protein
MGPDDPFIWTVDLRVGMRDRTISYVNTASRKPSDEINTRSFIVVGPSIRRRSGRMVVSRMAVLDQLYNENVRVATPYKLVQVCAARLFWEGEPEINDVSTPF